MWLVDFGEPVWADEANGDLTLFRLVGPFESWQVAKDFCERHPFLRKAHYYYVRSVAEFSAATPRV